MALSAASLVFAGGGTQQQGGSAASTTPMRIDIFDQAANFQGIQPGWFGKIIKDKFNIEINILAPQISGRSLYQRRAAAGNLGDSTILDIADFIESIKAGLLMDISGIIGNYKNLSAYTDQIKALNTAVPGVGA
jgi:multiple sugar transport system substrate-binding protein/putative aldouronate transport system substrate-binding protein